VLSINRATWPLLSSLVFIGEFLLFASSIGSAVTAARVQPAHLRLVREIESKNIGIASPAGLAYEPGADALLVLDGRQPPAGSARVALVTLLESPAGAWFVPGEVTSLAFDPRDGLLALDSATGQLVVARPAGVSPAAPRPGLAQPTLAGARGMTIDSASRQLFLLSADGARAVVFDLDDLDSAAAQPMGVVELGGLSGTLAIAFNPADRHLYALDARRKTLYELGSDGRQQSTRDLGPLQIGDPRGMVFAPSGDPTDDPAATSLYIADAGTPGMASSGRIVEVELTPPTLAALPAANSEASLVRMIDTSQWRPPSPDPSGITYLPASGRLLISDGEVEEMRIFEGYNIFESTLAGSIVNTHSSLGFSDEPTDVAIDPASGHLFFSDDNAKKIYEVGLGADGALGTGDDQVSSFSTQAFKCVDPEGLAFGDGKLFIADGLGREIYIVAPGPNGRFDGVAPTGDDQVTHFDTNRIDQPDPEGVGYNADRGTLFIISNNRRTNVVETTLTGNVVQTIDIQFLNAISPAGLVYAPNSQNPAMKSLYIVARGVDNDKEPNENDGKIYEIKFDDVPLMSTTTPKPTATQTPIPMQPPIERRYLPLIRQ
jgi:hypothetical protein